MHGASSTTTRRVSARALIMGAVVRDAGERTEPGSSSPAMTPRQRNGPQDNSLRAQAVEFGSSRPVSWATYLVRIRPIELAQSELGRREIVRHLRRDDRRTIPPLLHGNQLGRGALTDHPSAAEANTDRDRRSIMAFVAISASASTARDLRQRGPTHHARAVPKVCSEPLVAGRLGRCRNSGLTHLPPGRSCRLGSSHD